MTKKKAFTNPRCHAHRKDGSQCKNLSLHGMTVCRYHGGAAPNSRAKARERILAAADPAVSTVLEIMFDKRNAAPVRLAAARDLLDRADLSGRSVVEVQVDLDPTLLAMVAAARDRTRGELSRPPFHGRELAAAGSTDVVDAELADDDPDAGYVDLEFEGADDR